MSDDSCGGGAGGGFLTIISDTGVLVFIVGILGLIGTLITSILFEIPANTETSAKIVLITFVGLILMWCDVEEVEQ